MGTTWTFGKPGEKPKDPLSVEEAASTLHLIESLLNGADEADLPSDNILKLSLSDVLAMIPPQYVPGGTDTAGHDDTVSVTVDDLFAQLAKGKVAVSVARLAFSVPADMIDSQALSLDKEMIALPLAKVVSSIDPQLMAKKKAQMYRRYNIANFKDPFKRHAKPPTEEAIHVAESLVVAPTDGPPRPPAPKTVVRIPMPPEQAMSAAEATAPAPVIPPAPPVAAEPPAPVPTVPAPEVPVAVPAVAAEPPPAIAPALAKPKKVPAAPRKRKVVPEGAGELAEDVAQADKLGGVNLNTASVEQLLTIDGMTQAIAEAIMKHRSEKGPFKSVFDLAGVPGVGKGRFRKITGMPWSIRRIHRIWKLALLLDLPVSNAANLQAVAASSVTATQALGCVISDSDGLVLAESNSALAAEPVGAVVPRLMQQLAENMKTAQLGELATASLSSRDRTYTVAGGGRIFVTCIHDRKKLKRSQLVLVEKITVELSWLLSHRGYVGASAGA